MFLPTTRIPLSHVISAEADSDIERKSRRVWHWTQDKACVAEPGGRFYNSHHGRGDKAIVIHLQDHVCERLVVEVQDSAAEVEKTN